MARMGSPASMVSGEMMPATTWTTGSSPRTDLASSITASITGMAIPWTSCSGSCRTIVCSESTRAVSRRLVWYGNPSSVTTGDDRQLLRDPSIWFRGGEQSIRECDGGRMGS
jgi:hypothetical protein